MRLEIRRSVWYVPLGLVVALLVLGPGALEPGWSSDRILALASVAIAVLVLANRAALNEPVVILDEDGIWDKRWGFDTAIPWNGIRSVKECGIREICLSLEEPLLDNAANSGSPFKTKKSLSGVETHAWGLQISHKALLRSIRDRVDEARL